MRTGRPRTHADDAARQRAYRARKAWAQYRGEIERIRTDQRTEHDGYGFGGGVAYEIRQRLLTCGVIEKRPGYMMYRVTEADD